MLFIDYNIYNVYLAITINGVFIWTQIYLIYINGKTLKTKLKKVINVHERHCMPSYSDFSEPTWFTILNLHWYNNNNIKPYEIINKWSFKKTIEILVIITILL